MNANDQIKKIELKARQEDVPVMFNDGMELLLTYIQEHPGIMRILEAGTAVGLSSMKMASLRENITIDTCEVDENMYQQAVKNIHDARLDDRVFCHLIDAADYHSASYYDLFFIDAAKSQYQRYVEQFLPMSYVGSVFVFDNLSFHGIVDIPEISSNRSTIQMTKKIKKFREWLLNNDQFETTYYPDKGDGVAIAVRVK